MDNWAVGKLIDWAAGKEGNEKTKESLEDELCDFADKLAGPNPSPVETVLAETAATCWFAFRMHEAQYAGTVNQETGCRSPNPSTLSVGWIERTADS